MSDNDDQFNRISAEASPGTLLTPDRQRVIFNLALEVQHQPGHIAEVGVMNGGITKLLAKTLPHKRVLAYDTWTGIPARDPNIDRVNIGDFFGDYDKCKAFLSDCPNVEMRRGTFPGNAGPEDQFCIVHFDGDTYQCCKDFVYHFMPRMVRGGIIVFDDVINAHTPGVLRALVELGLAYRLDQQAAMQVFLRL